MCGLVGVVVKAMNGAMTSDMEMFNSLLYMDALRGWDSTGVASLHTNGEMQVLKEASEATFFLRTKEYKQLCTDFVKNGKAIIGHNRKATIGKVEDATAHPFVLNSDCGYGEVENDPRYAFIHNGTLRNHDKLIDTKVDVDSEALGMVLTKCNGDPSLIEKELDNVQGAYACMWIDQEKEELYMLRNKERPLYLAHTPFGHVMGSEYGFVIAACSRSNTKVDKIELIPEHTLITIDLSNSAIAVKEDKLTVKKSVPPSYTATVTKGGATSAKVAENFSSTDVSKNMFKKIRANYIGKTLAFWLDDYKPRTIGGPDLGEEWLIWGSNADTLKFEHKMTGKLSGMDETTLVWVCDTVPLYGKVEDVLYDKTCSSVTFILGDCTMATPSQASKTTYERPNWTH